MKLCIRAHDLETNQLKDLVQKVEEYHFSGIQLVCYKSFSEVSYVENSLSPQFLTEIKDTLQKNQIQIPLLGAYFNPVHSNPEKVRIGKEIFKNYLDYARELNTYVGTETGSYNDDSWTYNPKNQTDEGFEASLKIFEELKEYCEKKDTKMALEGAWKHVCYTPTVLKRMLDRLNSDHVYVIVDLFNYLNLENYSYHLDILKECLRLFKGRIIAFHLKDFILGETKLKQVSLGEGKMNYPEIVKLIEAYDPEVPCIFEGITKENIIKSIHYIKGVNNL